MAALWRIHSVPEAEDDNSVNYWSVWFQSQENCATHTNALQRGKFLGDKSFRAIANRPWMPASGGVESGPSRAKRPGLDAGYAKGGETCASRSHRALNVDAAAALFDDHHREALTDCVLGGIADAKIER
jgi:hypothetical protein